MSYKYMLHYYTIEVLSSYTNTLKCKSVIKIYTIKIFILKNWRQHG